MLESQNRILVVLCAIAALAALFAMHSVEPQRVTSSSAAATALVEAMDDVAKQWPDLPHIATAELARQMTQGNVVLFDVRQQAEYAVSHLPGAMHVAPGMAADDFVARFGDSVAGKLAVFYCSVGVRSSTLAARVADSLKARGARDAVDLAGGIFAWHNERRALVNAQGATDFVHPYDNTWGRLVARQKKVRKQLELQ